MHMIEIWRMKPEPRKVASVAEDLFWKYIKEREERYRYDLGTDWFGRMMASLFNNNAKGSTATATVIDVTGTNRTINITIGSTGINVFNDTNNYDAGAYIGIGTGTNTPSKQDYKLGNEVSRQSAQAKYTDGSSYFTVSANFTLTSDTQITEVGLYWKEGYSGYIWLLDHTLLTSPVTFPANTPMAVIYTFSI